MHAQGIGEGGGGRRRRRARAWVPFLDCRMVIFMTLWFKRSPVTERIFGGNACLVLTILWEVRMTTTSITIYHDTACGTSRKTLDI
jgi:hypothetical protein